MCSINEKIIPPDSLLRKVNVAVIGAGAAGLSCAQRLTSAGVKDIIIIEAQDRLGGRIFTAPCENSIVELGAQWIHGEEQNPLYKYCSDHDLLIDQDVFVTTEAKGLFCTSKADVIPESVIDDVMSRMQEAKETVNRCDYKHAESLSMKEVFRNAFEKYIITCDDDDDDVKVFKRGVFDWFMRFETIDNACDSLQDVTTLGYAAWIECPGQFYTSFKNGFCSFLCALLKDISVDHILTAKPVKCIHWKEYFKSESDPCLDIEKKPSTNFPVIIECSDGDWFAAQHIVLTPSVGFLSSNMKSFFVPNLPEPKARAFLNMGFGTVNKIFLIFSQPFWKKEELGFQLVWSDNSELSEMLSMPETSWIAGISGFDQVFNQPNILVAWIGGPHAKQMEDVSSDVVGKACVYLLKKFLNRQDIPYPCKVIRSQWFSNTYVKGAYSCRTKCFYEGGSMISDLNEPIFCRYTLHTGETVQWPVITFAGEAMDDEYFATVHGALRSGWKEADRIAMFLSDLKRKGGKN